MDPFSTTTAVLQIIGQCVNCSVALAKWIAQVKTVDKRLQDFATEVSNLEQTHRNLQQNLQDPHIIAAARLTNDASGQLWSQIGATLDDCQATLVAINRVLEKISKPTIFGKPMRQLQESLNSGELARYFQRIQNFNILLQLPMQMVTIKLQLSQQENTMTNHQELIDHIVTVKQTLVQMDDRIKRLRPNSTANSRYFVGQSSTVVDSQADTMVYDNLEKCVARAKNFISDASTVVSARSTSAGSVLQHNTGNPDRDGGILSDRQRLQINSWVGMPQQKPPTPAASENGFLAATMQQFEPAATSSAGADQVNLKLAKIYVENGQTDIEQEMYAEAEENFREALDLLKDHDFGQKIAFEPADIKLLLARCCFHQDNFAEAITLLEAVATPVIPTGESLYRSDPLRMLTADYLLGKVYLQMNNHINAEKHALKAFEGRLERLREHDSSFLESVQLMVAIYRAMGRGAKARAFSVWLIPHEPTSPKQRTTSHASEAGNHLQNFSRQATVPVIDLSPRTGNQPAIISKTSIDHNRLSAPPYLTQVVTNRSASNNPPSPFHDDASTSTEVTRTSTKLSEVRSILRRPLEPRFQAIKEIAIDSKDKAVSAAIKLLKTYDPQSRILILRTDEIKKNIKKRGSDLGLAATGQGYAPIHFFCDLPEEHVAELEVLIDAGVDLGALCHKAGVPGRDPMTPLQITIEKGHTNMSSIMIESLAATISRGRPVPDINTMYGRDGLPPLLSACRRGQVMIVAQLLEYGAKVTQGFPDAWYGNSLLHDSCQRCDTEMVKMLLGYQDQTNLGDTPSDIGSICQQDKLGKTPLMYAVTMSNVMTGLKEKKLAERHGCVEVLLQHASGNSRFGEYLHLRDQKGMDVFGYANCEVDEGIRDLLDRFAKDFRSTEVTELE